MIYTLIATFGLIFFLWGFIEPISTEGKTKLPFKLGLIFLSVVIIFGWDEPVNGEIAALYLLLIITLIIRWIFALDNH
jgi:hypothetical protein|tara:strand:+ start:624 stop:857 length:234 start_codon:yes stop_codon:yes gene_type:complete